jgi:hypothetical protein
MSAEFSAHLVNIGSINQSWVLFTHKKKVLLGEIFSVFGGHLISLNMPPRKEEGSYTYSLIVGQILDQCKKPFSDLW